MDTINKLIKFELQLLTPDYWILLFLGCLSLFLSIMWISLPFYLALKVRKRSDTQPALNPMTKCPLSEVVLYIQRNHLKSLSQAIESNPDLLYKEYKNQNLLMWCKHYNNSKAQSVVLQLSKKYPKTQLISA